MLKSKMLSQDSFFKLTFHYFEVGALGAKRRSSASQRLGVSPNGASLKVEGPGFPPLRLEAEGTHMGCGEILRKLDEEGELILRVVV